MAELLALPLRYLPSTGVPAPERGVTGAADVGDGRLRVIVEDIVANVFRVEPELLRLPNRGRANVALARQVAMYIAHVGYGLNLTDVGRVFERDRTTVAHACILVEQRREDAEFDAALVLIECITRAANGPYVGTAVSGKTWEHQSPASPVLAPMTEVKSFPRGP